MSDSAGPKAHTLRMVGNAHIDPVWLWQWPEGLESARSTFKSALDRMEETPEFIFTCSSAVVYQWIEKTDPALFERIKEAVESGKWCIVGGWWIEPDCNIPSGESFARQSLYGQRYFKEKFGVMARAGYNIDSFGHNGMLPQILKKSGMDYYVFMRPMSHEKALPPLFWWESDDGSRVLTYRIPIAYNSEDGHLGKRVERFLEEVQPLWPDMMIFYGVGNHGGGPTKEAITSIIEMNADPNMPRLEFSNPDRFFQEVEKQELNLPVVHGELQHHASGCYSVMSEIKRNNRKAENTLLVAEKFSVIADILVGRKYPRGAFTQAWHDLLFNQFHDIMGGTCIPEAYEDARNLHGRCLQVGTEELTFSTQAIASRIDTSGVDPVLIVFNPHSWRVKVPIEFRPSLDGLEDDDGKSVLHQKVKNLNIITQRERSAAVVEVPPLGYQVYRNSKKALSRDEVEARGTLSATATTLENRWLRLDIESRTGYISELFDKVNGIRVFSDRSAVPVVIDDPSDTWSHGVFEFKDECARFTDARVSLMESGPVRARLRVESRYNNSNICQDFILHRELAYVESRVTVDWRESYKMLKLRFAVNVEEPEVTYEIPFGHIVRPANGEEEPGQNWVDVTGQATTTYGERIRYGVSLLNDCKYSYDVRNAEIGFTILRSPSYADHQTNGDLPGVTYQSIDNGIQTFKYLILPHRDTWREAGTVHLGWELNQPPVWIVESNHSGYLPERMSFIEISPGNILLSALKKHEDSEDLIVRVYEAEGEATVATIKLPFLDREWSAKLGPCEIKTFRISRDKTMPVCEVDLLERSCHERNGGSQ
ncbi:MAG: alpha-mannosidase [Firmicutes bacterium]|nr:alpha-mannosidase [Bacillota bacterium]